MGVKKHFIFNCNSLLYSCCCYVYQSFIYWLALFSWRITFFSFGYLVQSSKKI